LLFGSHPAVLYRSFKKVLVLPEYFSIAEKVEKSSHLCIRDSILIDHRRESHSVAFMAHDHQWTESINGIG
jgi:hypothetical protein